MPRLNSGTCHVKHGRYSPSPARLLGPNIYSLASEEPLGHTVASGALQSPEKDKEDPIYDGAHVAVAPPRAPAQRC